MNNQTDARVKINVCMNIVSLRNVILAIIVIVAVLFVVPQTVFAATGTLATSTPRVNDSFLNVMRIFGANMGLSDTDPRIVIARLIRVAMGFVGIVVVLMILSSGLKFMVSGGNKEKVENAKRTFYNAIIGLIIILSAYSIVAFVFNILSAAGV